MFLQGLASLMVKANPSLSAASIIASGAALTSRSSRGINSNIFRRICIRVVKPLIRVAIVVVDGE